MKYIGATIPLSRNKPNDIKKYFDDVKCNSFACFLKPRLSKVVSLYPDNFVNYMNTVFKDVPILPHSSYVINLASNDKDRYEESVKVLVNEVELAAQINSNIVFHPGSCENLSDGIKNIINGINKVHELTEYKKIINPISSKLTYTGITIIETMGGKNNSKIVGKTFDELKQIIDGIKDKRRVGICLDTCHVFVAGYDIRTKELWEKTIQEFDQKIGINMLKGFHLNDSEKELGSGHDIHAPIGKGKIGLEPFKCIINDSRFDDIPLITETHLDVNHMRKEIELLNSLKT